MFRLYKYRKRASINYVCVKKVGVFFCFCFFKAWLGGGSPCDSVWEGRQSTAFWPQSSQQASHSLARCWSIVPLLSESFPIHFFGGGRGRGTINLDGARPHPRTAFRLMETYICKNVRECVRSSEKVRLDLRVRACVFGCESCQGPWKMKHHAGRRVDVLSLDLIAASVQTGN